MSPIDDRPRGLVPDHCWDTDRNMQFRWEMPDNDLAVDVDDDGDVTFLRGRRGSWTVQGTHYLTADEAQWMRNVWPALVEYVTAEQPEDLDRSERQHTPKEV